MPQCKLTSRTIEAHRRRQFVGTLWDTELSGFGLRLSPTGRGSWLIKRRLGEGGRNAKQVLHVFGDLGDIPDLDEARDKARSILVDIRSGADPSEIRRRKRTTSIQAYHSGKLCDVFDKFKELNEYEGRYWQEIERIFTYDVLPAIGPNTLISNITKRDIRDLVEAKAKQAPGMARYLFSALRPFFKWCVERDLIAVSPMESLTAPRPLASRDRVLSDTEIKALWNGTAEMPELWGSYYRVLLLTAQRREEVASMQWSEVDLEQGVWTIPKERTKNGKAHLVHLSPLVVAILKGVPRIPESAFVFTTTGATPISGYSKAKLTLDALIGEQITTPWRVHDLRRTAASGMAKLGIPPHIIERVLNHVSGVNGGLVAVYQRHEYIDERRKALLAWSNYVEAITSESIELEEVSYKANNVLPFRL